MHDNPVCSRLIYETWMCHESLRHFLTSCAPFDILTRFCQADDDLALQLSAYIAGNERCTTIRYVLALYLKLECHISVCVIFLQVVHPLIYYLLDFARLMTIWRCSWSPVRLAQWEMHDNPVCSRLIYETWMSHKCLRHILTSCAPFDILTWFCQADDDLALQLITSEAGAMGDARQSGLFSPNIWNLNVT